jgi:hypothetical protein
MRQRTVTDYVTLPMMPALHVCKSLITDLSACGALVLVELGLLAFLIHLGLLDPLKSLRPLGDNRYYEAMARSPFSSDPLVHTGPYYWRVLTPWLVYLLTKLGLSVQGGFLLLTIISLCGAVTGIYVLLRLCGATLWQALAVALLVHLECEDFANAIRTGVGPRAHGGVGLRVVQVLAAAQEALEQQIRQNAMMTTTG